MNCANLVEFVASREVQHYCVERVLATIEIWGSWRKDRQINLESFSRQTLYFPDSLLRHHPSRGGHWIFSRQVPSMSLRSVFHHGNTQQKPRPRFLALRHCLAAVSFFCLWLAALPASGQGQQPSNGGAGQFLSSSNPDAAAAGATLQGNPNDSTLPQVARLLQPPTSLGNEAGQVWRRYDLSPYTRRITTVKNPEQAVVDWVLRETGTEIWFKQPMGIMTVGADRLDVYHTPEVQKKVAHIIDRLVASRGKNMTMGIRMITVGRPDWRAAAFPYMTPFDVQTPGVEGWLISKENAAVLLNQLSVRSDYRPLEIGDLVLPSGQSHTFQRLSPQSYIRSLQFRANNPNLPAAGGQYEPLTSRFQEGYTIDISPLEMLDGQMSEVVIKCQIDQLERLQSVTIPVPTLNGQSQNLSTAVPQVVSWRLHERFRWPNDKVLLLSCGVIATPTGDNRNPSLLNLGPLLGQQRGRGDALLFVEYKGDPAQLNNQGQPNQAGRFMPTAGNGPYNSGYNPNLQYQNFGNPWLNSNSNNGFQAPPSGTSGPSVGNQMTNPGFQPSIAVPTGPPSLAPTQSASGLFPIRR